MEIQLPTLEDFIKLKNERDKENEHTPNLLEENFNEFPRLREIITHWEAHWWMEKVYPSYTVLGDKFKVPFEDWEKYLNRISGPLEARGLPPIRFTKPLLKKPPVLTGDPEIDLDPEFVLAVNVICAVSDKRSTASKLKVLGISPQKWQALLLVPQHKKYFEKRMADVFDSVEFNAKAALAKNVDSGDLQSIKYYHEYTGKFRPQDTSEFNLIKVISTLMEILVEYLNPQSLEAVASRFEQVILETSAKELTQ